MSDQNIKDHEWTDEVSDTTKQNDELIFQWCLRILSEDISPTKNYLAPEPFIRKYGVFKHYLA